MPALHSCIAVQTGEGAVKLHLIRAMNVGARILLPLLLVAVVPGVHAIESLSLTNSVWRYNQSGTNPGTAWIDPLYDDSSWPGEVRNKS